MPLANSTNLDDLFEIVTPDGVQRRIDTLREAWLSLINSNQNNEYIKSEYRSYLNWYTAISDSYFSKLFATGTLNELDSWQKRYESAYLNASNKSLSPTPNSIVPEAPELPLPNLNILLVVIGIGGVAYLVSQYSRIKSITSRVLP